MTDDVQMIAIDRIKLSGDNMRLEATDVGELAQSIRKDGLLQPIVVTPRGGAYVLVCGHRRLAACREIGSKRIQAVVREFATEDGFLGAMFAENLHRKALSPIEEALAIKRLVDRGLRQIEVAERIGKSDYYVSVRMTLLKLPHDVQQLVHEGELSIDKAIAPMVKPGKGRSRSPEVRDQATRWQLFYIDKLVRWIQGGNIPKEPELWGKLETLRQALRALAGGSTDDVAIPIPDRRWCHHEGCTTPLSKWNKGDYCGAHEREHVAFA